MRAEFITPRFVGAVLLFAAWGGLVYLGRAPVEPFTIAISSALTGLGIFHATTTPKDTDK